MVCYYYSVNNSYLLRFCIMQKSKPATQLDFLNIACNLWKPECSKNATDPWSFASDSVVHKDLARTSKSSSNHGSLRISKIQSTVQTFLDHLHTGQICARYHALGAVGSWTTCRRRTISSAVAYVVLCLCISSLFWRSSEIHLQVNRSLACSPSS